MVVSGGEGWLFKGGGLSAPGVLAMRQVLLEQLLSPATLTAGGAAAALVDQVFLASAQGLALGGGYATFNDTSALNLEGNTLGVSSSSDTSAALLDYIAGAGATASAMSPNPAGRLLSAGGQRRRRLELFLSPLPPTSAPSNTSTLCFNLLAASPTIASAMLTALTVSPVEGADPDVSSFTLSAALSTALALPVTLVIDASSIRAVTLRYRRSTWLLLWQLLVANALRVLIGVGVAALGVGALLCARARCAAAALARRAARAGALRSAYAALQARNRHGASKGAEAWGGRSALPPALRQRVAAALLRHLRRALLARAREAQAPAALRARLSGLRKGGGKLQVQQLRRLGARRGGAAGGSDSDTAAPSAASRAARGAARALQGRLALSGNEAEGEEEVGQRRNQVSNPRNALTASSHSEREE